MMDDDGDDDDDDDDDINNVNLCKLKVLIPRIQI